MNNKIKKDKNSLYVLVNKNIYRPKQSEFSYTKYGHISNLDTTKFKHYQNIRIKELNDKNIVSLRSEDGKMKEIWYYHGSLERHKKSSSCWCPKES